MAVYGMEYVNASRVLKAKYKRNRNKDGLTLAERIKMGRYGSQVVYCKGIGYILLKVEGHCSIGSFTIIKDIIKMFLCGSCIIHIK